MMTSKQTAVVNCTTYSEKDDTIIPMLMVTLMALQASSTKVDAIIMNKSQYDHFAKLAEDSPELQDSLVPMVADQDDYIPGYIGYARLCGDLVMINDDSEGKGIKLTDIPKSVRIVEL